MFLASVNKHKKNNYTTISLNTIISAVSLWFTNNTHAVGVNSAGRYYPITIGHHYPDLHQSRKQQANDAGKRIVAVSDNVCVTKMKQIPL